MTNVIYEGNKWVEEHEGGKGVLIASSCLWEGIRLVIKVKSVKGQWSIHEGKKDVEDKEGGKKGRISSETVNVGRYETSN